ncbi:MAG: DUF99 family protein [Candidatus Aenigmarchaeota archaeon]|nr:DUF99 family protein [Candidatus Aenigmarchaeota archaeon]
MPVKREIRVLGIDDGPFKKGDSQTILVGIITRGGKDFDGMLMTEIDVDGLNATENIIKVVKNSKYFKELRVLMFKGVTIGGFNIIDVERLYQELKLPIIIVSRKRPNFKKILSALKNLKDWKTRWKLIKNAGKVYKLEIKNNKNIYFQFKGVEIEKAKEVILLTTTKSLLPEPIRLAHMIASAIVKGESGGRA